MAYIILAVAHGIVTGIGVDTHMHRIFNQLAWVKSKTPEQVCPRVPSSLSSLFPCGPQRPAAPTDAQRQRCARVAA
eukprot:2654352-Rhodomonas_salina.1